MARNAEVNVGFHGDDSDLQRTFDDVGAGAKQMAGNIEKSTADSNDGFDRLGEGVDGAEGKFRGFGDTIGGTSDIMQGFKDGNLVGVAMGFADLAGGLSDFVLPAFAAVRGFIMTSLMPALTAVATHPLFLAVLAGGAIILGLILLEKKFGVVTGAIRALGAAAGAVWDAIKTGIEAVIGVIGGLVDGIRTVWNSVLGGKGFSFGGWDPPGPGPTLPGFELRIPKLHTGGVVPGVAGQEVLARLQAGETVNARGQASSSGVTIIVQGSLLTERDLGRIVADAQRQNQLIGVT
ncbi:MAG TPA: hypothetical protein VJS45_14970 [Acidimicrobiia bacterium]|nr:hypothetical protein [Acidimicrobiia bacterium]